MTYEDPAAVFTPEAVAELFPADRADAFFEALFGDASEGAYDIDLSFEGQAGNTLRFVFNLRQRPGHCLACNLTYGLPQVFSRHPIINVEGVVRKMESLLGLSGNSLAWELGATRQISAELHVLPLLVTPA